MQINRLDNLLQMLEKQPEDPFLIYAIALEYHSQDKNEDANIYFEKLLIEHTAYLPVYYQAGLFHVQLGDIKRALDLFRKGMLLAHSQNNVKTYNELRELHSQIEDEFDE
jgi:tetratricopeptide (TPR) repeat protein